ncbi:MAG: protein-export chaperone SecB [Legionella sp.]|nr:protein-export chaperone SecB [Legionella sp.]
MLDNNKITETLSSTQESKSTVSNEEPRLTVHKIYNKGLQFVVHGLSDELTKNWNPQISLQANPRIQLLESGQYEVILAIHLSGQQLGKAIFQIQVEQAGLFSLQQVAEEQKDIAIYGACANALFPYAAVMVNQLLSQAGLPHLYLNPMDFIALYKQHQKQAQKQEHSVEPIETLQ